MTVSLLSPLAEPYNPPGGYEICICNDGVPEMSPADVKSESTILHGITDEAIDDCFPPTAEEVAEIEAAEKFVAIMAHFALLEEMEEHDRTDFSDFPKRWEARRAEGLVGKPRPPVVHPEKERSAHIKAVHETTLVTYDQQHKNLALLQNKERERVRAEEKRMYGNTKLPKKRIVTRRPLIQPRKLC